MNKIPRYRVLVPVLIGAGLMMANFANAQQPAVAGAPAAVSAPAERDQCENYIRVLKAELAQAEARISTMRTQLQALDADIESRVDRIVSLLVSVRDSNDGPGNRIRKSKEDALDGLKATVAYYSQKRDGLRRELEIQGGRVDEEMLARAVAALNARIETRVTQSLEIASSLVRNGNTDTAYSGETPAHRKSRQDAEASVKIKADLVADLRSSIEKQTREVAAREEELRNTTDPQKRDQLAKDNEVARQTIAARRDQIEELLVAQKPATRSVSGKAAFEMDKLLDDMTAELRRDFAKFKIQLNEIDAARIRVEPLRVRLEQATAMLEAMDREPAPSPAK